MPDEPLETVDVRNNRESRAAAASHASPVARASDGGAVPRQGPAAGNPVAGREINHTEAAAAVERAEE